MSLLDLQHQTLIPKENEFVDNLILRKRIRTMAARLGILRPLRQLVFRLRGSDYFQNQVKFHRRFIGKDSLVFDVGANRGQSAEIYLALGARVIAFEPQEDLHKEILQVCNRNSRLQIVPKGLGDTAETRTFYITSYDQVASLREDWEGTRVGETSIEITTLNRQIDLFGLPDYCKIDVEGWEQQVVNGLDKPIPLISFEYHQSDAEIVTAKKVLEKIAGLGAYFCNIKVSDGDDFHLAQFMPIQDFIDLFPNDIEPSLNTGYGDIYCALQIKDLHNLFMHES